MPYPVFSTITKFPISQDVNLFTYYWFHHSWFRRYLIRSCSGSVSGKFRRSSCHSCCSRFAWGSCWKGCCRCPYLQESKSVWDSCHWDCSTKKTSFWIHQTGSQTIRLRKIWKPKHPSILPSIYLDVTFFRLSLLPPSSPSATTATAASSP